MTDQDKYRLKSCHKINGILFEKNIISQYLTEFIIYKGGKTKRYIRFITFDKDVITQLSTTELKARLKVKFRVNSKTYTGRDNIKRWSTDLIAAQVEDWKKNEAKRYKAEKQEQQNNENTYQKSLFTGDTGEWVQK